MKIAIGVDHRGFAHKEFIKKNMSDIEWIDVGTFDEKRTDYPLYAHKVVEKMVTGDADCGILICGTGVGMAITANRYKNIFAALAWNEEIAQFSKSHDNANILVLPSDYISFEQSVSMIQSWLSVEFKKGRYEQRIKMIDNQ